MQWHLLNLSNEPELREVVAVSKSALAGSRLGARAFDLQWRSGAGADRSTLRVFALRDDATTLGLALFSIHRKPLTFRLGEISIGSVDFARHWHVGEPYLDSRFDAPAAAEAFDKLVDVAVARLGRKECLFFEGLPVDGAARGALGTDRSDRPWIVLKLGDDFDHQFIQLPDTFTDYVAQLGSRSRQSLLYSQRRLLKDMGGDVRCECFESEESVERFVADATAVSRKTYQWNLLNLGLRDSAALSDSLRFAARNGWLRSFLLYCRETPVAFMLGGQYGDCYYYDDVGYDPDFSKWSVGSVLQLEVLQQLLARADKPRNFDFSTGYGEHKGRFGNYSRKERNVLVFPRNTRNRVLRRLYSLTDQTSKATARLLAKAGVKDRLKQLIRRRSGRKSGP